MGAPSVWEKILSAVPAPWKDGWAFAVLGVILFVSLAVLLVRHVRGDWSPRRIRRAFKKMDALDAVEATEQEYAEPYSMLKLGLHGQAAAWAVDRLADTESPSRRRYLSILQMSDYSDSRERLVAIAKDVSDPLASEVWSLLTGRDPSLWKKALLGADEGADFAPPSPPSGIASWSGYYRQIGAEHRMALSLSFNGSSFTGGGQDVVGPFRITGEIRGQEVRFSKCYPQHTVAYEGCLEGETIVGRWRLPLQGGEFRLWPIRPGPQA